MTTALHIEGMTCASCVAHVEKANQVRAILRAATVGPARILVPLVTRTEQLDFVIGTVEQARAELQRECHAFGRCRRRDEPDKRERPCRETLLQRRIGAHRKIRDQHSMRSGARGAIERVHTGGEHGIQIAEQHNRHR